MRSDTRLSTSLFPWFFGPLLFGCLALYLGQDANWDLRNYHFYNAYSFLFHRFDFDIAPAQVASFYNPLLYVPFYELVTRFSPKMVGFVLGALQGLNFPLLIGILRCTLASDKRPWWQYYALGLIGVLGAGNISETGTMFADNLLSLFVLSSLWLLLANYRYLNGKKMSHAFYLACTCGILMGAAAGLKQPSVIFAVGWCLAFFVIPVSFVRRICLAFFFGVGVLGGIAVTGGYWMSFLWSRFANPLFPYFNQFFHSAMALPESYRDARFLPGSIKDALLFPFLIVTDPRRTGEIFFRDVRFAVFYIILILAVVYAIRKRVGGGRPFSTEVKNGWEHEILRYKRLFLLSGALVAYVVWLKLFAIYRYVLLLEMFAPLGIVLLFRALPWRPWLKNAAAVFCLSLILVTLRPGNWGRVSWGSSYFGFVPPAVDDPDNAMVLMTGVDPMAYVIPFFPKTVRFLRIQSYFSGPAGTPDGYDILMENLVAKQHGPLYVLYRSYEKGASLMALNAYGLAIDTTTCKDLRPHIEEHLKSPLVFCALTRANISKGNENNL